MGNRIIVGGAGGGGFVPEMCGYLSGGHGGAGGNASGEEETKSIGCTGGCVGWCLDWRVSPSGKQTSGNALGVGQDGSTNDINGQPGGGGGGGYYGGHNHITPKGLYAYAGGGGGSSFISGYTAGGCTTAQGKASVSSSWTRGARSGHGLARITYCGDSAC